MAFQSEPDTIRWKLHCNSAPQKVFDALATDEGRASFWAESATETNNFITFTILGYEPYRSRIIKRTPPTQFCVEYFGTTVDFRLKESDNFGTDLTMLATNVNDSIRMEMTAGWISVLMAMKAYVDHGVDLRNHDITRNWSAGFVDN